MLKKILYILLASVIVVGAAISYKQLDFGGKTTIFFKIVAGDQEQMMKGPRKFPPVQGKPGEFKPPEGFKDGQRGEFRPGPGGESGPPGRQGMQGPPRGKGMHGKPGMGKIISLQKVIPYFFILAFFILFTRVLDVSIRKIGKR